MAIPRRFLLLDESRNRGIEERQFTIPRGSRKKESIPRGPQGISRNGMLFHSTHFSGFTGIFGTIISNFFVEFFQKMLYFLVFLVFSRSSRNFGEDPRIRGVIESIPRGIEESKKVRNLEGRGIPRAIPTCQGPKYVFAQKSL